LANFYFLCRDDFFIEESFYRLHKQEIISTSLSTKKGKEGPSPPFPQRPPTERQGRATAQVFAPLARNPATPAVICPQFSRAVTRLREALRGASPGDDTGKGVGDMTDNMNGAFRNVILHGDSVALMRAMPRESVDFILTDAPYSCELPGPGRADGAQ
jgi:hypothetical protein